MQNALSMRTVGTVFLALLEFAVVSTNLHAQAKKPNILGIVGDDIGWYNTSICNRGDMGYQTPNIGVLDSTEARERQSRRVRARTLAHARAAS